MSNRYNSISTEQLLLINILNEMYNNNIRQINNHQDAIDGLNEANNNIRATLIQMLNVNGTRRPNASNTSNANSATNASNRSNGTSNLNYYFPNTITYLTSPLRRQNGMNLNGMNLNGMNLNGMNLESFFSPVEVLPTPSQVEAATRRVRYCDIVSPLNRSCPISLEEFNDNDMVSVIRQCGHIFITDELNTWFRSNCKCPVCRYDIRNYNTNASSSSYFNQTDVSGNLTNVSDNNINSNSNSNSNSSNNNNSNVRLAPISNSNRNNSTERMINVVLESFLNEYAGTDASGNQYSPDVFRLLLNNYL